MKHPMTAMINFAIIENRIENKAENTKILDNSKLIDSNLIDNSNFIDNHLIDKSNFIDNSNLIESNTKPRKRPSLTNYNTNSYSLSRNNQKSDIMKNFSRNKKYNEISNKFTRRKIICQIRVILE